MTARQRRKRGGRGSGTATKGAREDPKPPTSDVASGAEGGRGRGRGLGGVGGGGVVGGGGDCAPLRPLIPRSDGRAALLLWAAAFSAYVSNGAVDPGRDTAPNLYLPIQIFRGRLTWGPEENPALFSWRLKRGDKYEWVNVPPSMDGTVEGTGSTARELLAREEMYARGSKYILAETVHEGRYVNTFNLGTGITFLPVAAVLALRHGFDLDALQMDGWLLVYAGKTLASALVAASASFVYLSARTFPSVSRAQAVASAVAYMLGTCAWSVSSQALGQHATNKFYISVALWALLKAQRQHAEGGGWPVRLGALCGFTVAMATTCRPTSAVLAVTIGVYLLSKRSVRMVLAYGGAGAVLGALQLYYNYHYFGNPFEFGQTKASLKIAKSKTGTADLWQTPILTGAATLLFSPNRGLFVFSPFMLFALPGFYFIWLPKYSGSAPSKKKGSAGEDCAVKSDGNEFEALRPACIHVLFLWATQFKFFDYWGGWCYGYRPLVDTMPMLTLLLCTAINRIWMSPRLSALFLIAVLYSCYVQYLGAYAFDVYSWNSRPAEVFRPTDGGPAEWAFDPAGVARLARRYPDAPHEKVQADIDKEEYRARLWHWTDSQILYYNDHFDASCRVKHKLIETFVKYH